MSEDSGTPPTADEAAQQEADKIDHALEQLGEVQETIADIAADFEARRDELTADAIIGVDPGAPEGDRTVEIPMPDGIVELPLGKSEDVVGTIAPAADALEEAAESEGGIAEDHAVTRPADTLRYPEMPTTDVPFPHDVNSAHPIDNLEFNTTITKTSRFGYRIDAPSRSVDGNPITAGDAMAHLPVGTEIVVGRGAAAIGVAMPGNGDRRSICTVAPKFHQAVAQLWPWLVTEGTSALVGSPHPRGPTSPRSAAQGKTMTQDAVERRMVKVEIALAVDVDVGPNHPSEEELTKTLEQQFPQVIAPVLAEFRRLVAGGSLSSPPVEKPRPVP